MAARILVAEDEPDIMRIITHTLQAVGHQVIPAYGGEDAIRKVKSHKPDLVLTDLAMPKVTGVQVIQAIRADDELKNIPVIAVTAHVWEGIGQSAGQVGCDDYLPKPFSMKQLLQIVDKHLPQPKEEVEES